MLTITPLSGAASIESLLAVRTVKGRLVFIGKVLFEHVPFIVLLQRLLELLLAEDAGPVVVLLEHLLEDVRVIILEVLVRN
mmetsp:Transcript_22700/g.21886  ORF Transcript_22700/g.21886 Transcript_22700/m.21886 type:complete len:81 (+) Transcript_22700:440-682(+)